MSSPRKSDILRRIERQRQAIHGRQLPVYNSLIALNLCLLLCECEMRGTAPRVKDLLAEVKASPGAARRLLQAMVRDDWIVISRSGADLRAREVYATPKLREAIAAVVN